MHVYCYIYVGGKLVQQNDGVWENVGSQSKGIRVYKGMSFEEFTSRILKKFDISLNTMKMHYILKFNPKVIQDLEDMDALDNVIFYSDDFVEVYLVESSRLEGVEENMSYTQLENKEVNVRCERF